MNLSDYQQAVARTCATREAGQAETLKLALVGLQDELGEVAGPLKKYLWHGHPLDYAHLQEEIGDLLWYLATLCNALDIALLDVVQGNLDKLQQRYPHGFSPEQSLKREHA
jgi:NTP pyrophosphatase (non-canonical NTP hydrolase)